MEQQRECKHMGNPPWKNLGEKYASKWGFSRQRPNANDFRPLLKTSKKGNTKFTREGMAGAKPRTPPSSAHQIYGKVPAKIFHTLFCKGIDRGKKTKDLPKYGGNLHGKRDMCMHHILEKCRNPNCSFYHAQAK